MKRGVFLLVFLLIATVGQAQEPMVYKRSQSVFGELWGVGYLYSVNYDTRFAPKRNGLGARVGAGYWNYGEHNQLDRFSVPVQLNYLLGKRSHLFEAGAGVTYLYSDGGGSVWGATDEPGSALYPTLLVGYRYQPLKGITARAGGTVMFGSFLDAARFHVSLGYAF